jgi:hypothetical protein
MSKLKESIPALRVRLRLLRKDTRKPKINPVIESLIKQSGSQSGRTPLLPDWEKYENEPSFKARAALDQLFLQAQGKEWRDRYTAALSDVKPVSGGDSAALHAYASLVRKHVENLNSLVATHRDLLLPFSQNCFSWPARIGKRNVFGDDPDELIRQLQVGKNTIADDSASRFDPTSKFGKVAWELIERIELCRAASVARHVWYRPKSWDTTAKTLSPFNRKASPADKKMWLAVVEQVLKDDFRDPEQAASYRCLITAPSHKRRWKAVFFDKVRGEFDSLWGLHRRQR